MKSDAQRYIGLLDQRLIAFRLLAVDLDASRLAYVTLDLRAIHQHTARQDTLCQEIRALDAELQDLRGTLSKLAASGEIQTSLEGLEAQWDAVSARQLDLLLGGLKTIQADVRRLCRVHSELLRRSRRSVNVLINFLAHYSGSYPSPIPPAKQMPRAWLGN